MGLIEIITCDMCNAEGEIDLELMNSVDDGARFMCSDGEEHAETLGWEIVHGCPYMEHVCPECQMDFEEEDDDSQPIEPEEERKKARHPPKGAAG